MRIARRLTVALASLAQLGCGGGNSSEHAEHGKAAAPVAASAPEAASPPTAKKTGAYAIDLRVDPPPVAGARSRLTLDPRTPVGERVQRLAIVHEKPLHLLLVSRDLSYFAHEHPAVQPDGTLVLDLVMPPAGEYVAFADFTPEGEPQQIVRVPVTVPGNAAQPKPLVVDDRSKPKAFGELRVSLGPATIAAGDAGTMLAFTVLRGDTPVTELRPYLGAMGHCVIISEDTADFLHSHPQEAPGPQGHVVEFHTVFPRTGLYKVWGQFDVGGELLIADFVVDVAEGGSGEAAHGHEGGEHHH